jgi:nitrate/TMAO reductase-like tetraheme cytochrome c subunit
MSVPVKRPSLFSRKTFFGTTIGAALVFMAVGVIFWGGFNTAMEVTNTKEFCISCHEMEENVYQEFKGTVHDGNRSGVGAGCPDCHVPRPWVHKVVRKIQASNELFHKAMGTVSTPEKFEAQRLIMAKRVWAAMKKTDSRECRNCHDFSTMEPDKQKPRAYQQHRNAVEKGNTCIDCHKGIAHKKVHDKLSEEEIEALEAPNPRFIRELPPRWLAFETLEAEKAAQAVAQAVAATPETPAASATPVAVPSSDTGGSGIDWSKAGLRQVVLFYPGLSSLEWTLTGSEHSGARAVTKAGDRCFICHDKEAADMGQKIVTGEKLEPTPIPGKRGSIPLSVRASHDTDNLYLRFEWPDTGHAPVPFIDGGKMDVDNQIKLALMIAEDSVEFAGQTGCWATCHHDLNSMPDEVDGQAHKYIKESRTELQIRPADGKKRGGFEARRDDAEIEAALASGHFLDFMRFKSGNGGVTENGYVLADRVMESSGAAELSGHLENGVWVVELRRPLKPQGVGEIALEPGKLYNIGFAIHDDYSAARWHHVSLGYKLGLDNPDAEINAVTQ